MRSQQTAAMAGYANILLATKKQCKYLKIFDYYTTYTDTLHRLIPETRVLVIYIPNFYLKMHIIGQPGSNFTVNYFYSHVFVTSDLFYNIPSLYNREYLV